MEFAKIAGYKWSPELIDWGRRGRGGAAAVAGYYPKQLEGLRGRLSTEEIRRRTLDLWPVHSVYALFQKDSLLYIGEGVLGDCLLRHHRGDEFVGRWDAFSWVSPWDMEVTPEVARLLPREDDASITIRTKQLIEELETILICLTEPPGNRQTPWAEDRLKWLDQAKPEGYLTLEEKIDRILERLN